MYAFPSSLTSRLHYSHLFCLGIFLNLDDKDSALKVFHAGEQAFFTVMGGLLSKNTLKLDQCSPAIIPIRQLVLTQASLMDSPRLFADITVRWKSLFAELRHHLVRRGLGSMFRDVFDWYRVEKSRSADISDRSADKLLTDHMTKEETLLKNNAVSVMDCICQQNYSQVSQQLREGEIVFEYIFFATTQANPLLDAYCIVMSSKAEPFIQCLNFAAIRNIAAVIGDLLAHLLEKKNGEWSVNPVVEGRVRTELYTLMCVLVPKELVKVLPVQILHLYICTDADIASLPLDMMPLSTILPDLSSDFSLTTLFSSRELLRLTNLSSDAPGSCCIVSDPNCNLSVPKQSMSFFAKLMELTSLSSILDFGDSTAKYMDPLPYSREEATAIEKQLRASHLRVQVITANDATLTTVLSIARPLLLHICTHAEAASSRSIFRNNFWSDLNSSIILAGYNTYASGKYSEIDADAGTGNLPALAIYSMDLCGTRLVFLSACSSAVGESLAQEAVGGLVEAFQLAGTETVVATLWPIADRVAAEFSEEFYSALLQKGVRPSLALQHAKESMQSKFKHLFYWGSFACYGLDRPLI